MIRRVDDADVGLPLKRQRLEEEQSELEGSEEAAGEEAPSSNEEEGADDEDAGGEEDDSEEEDDGEGALNRPTSPLTTSSTTEVGGFWTAASTLCWPDR